MRLEVTSTFAQADARSLLALVDIENRRKAREAKEAVDKERFEKARDEAIRRKRETGYVEAGSLVSRSVETTTDFCSKMKETNPFYARRRFKTSVESTRSEGSLRELSFTQLSRKLKRQLSTSSNWRENIDENIELFPNVIYHTAPDQSRQEHYEKAR